ncbi:MAG: sensor domain-containing phosphodiesterase [Phormidesmis sp.]
MTVVPWPAKETLRLAKLQDYSILDTLPEAAYNDIVELAAHICQTPIALVSLIDADRQWFKANVGLDVAETPRDIAFCHHTIQGSDVMVVEDTHQNPRFCDNPLVSGPPYIRFYAGAPLLTPDGYALGSLCVIDYKPRQFTAQQQQALQALSRQVVAQLELRYQTHQLKLAKANLEQRVKERTAGLTSALHRLLKAQSNLLRRNASQPNSLKDPLTGLPNRSYFLQRLAQSIEITRRQPTHLYAVLLIDLNDFKPVNEVLGPEVGDRLLQQVADKIERSLRKSDLVTRLGGDEFAALLDGISGQEHAIEAVKRLQNQLKTPFVFNGQTVFISASIGVTFGTLGYRQPEAALKDAHIAMRHAKRQIKNRVKAQLNTQLQDQIKQQGQNASEPSSSPILIQDEMLPGGQHFSVFDIGMQDQRQPALTARPTLENELRQALSDGQFHLYYQPIFELLTQKPSGLDVRLRWHHPTRGVLEADAFIEVAENIGIVRQICAQVIQTACQALKKWRSHPAGSTLSLHVNLSLFQIRWPQLVSQWQSGLREYGLPPSAFQLEIDEQILLSSDPSIVTALQQLKDSGFGLCVDNFGRGHSSLSRLHQLNVDALKIDHTFVEALLIPGNVEIVKTMIDLGRSADIAVIAKGIETGTQLAALTNLGCRFAQGPRFGDVLAAIAVDDLLETLDPGKSA